MYSEDDLESAVTAGVLTPEAAAAFRTHATQLRSAPVADEEHFRLVTGFNDIFVVIASVLLLASLSWIGTAALGPALGAAAVAVAAWGLCEFFVRRRRMALPAIVLLLAFVGSVLVAGLYGLSSLGLSGYGPLTGAAALAAAAAGFHWWRFRVPITVAAGCAAVLGFLIAVLLGFFPTVRNYTTLLFFVAGAAVFALAMRWDAADTRRQSRRSDVAFWLHLLAAPLLVHSAFSALGVTAAPIGTGQALAVVALYIVIALVSLAIDRRALMVAALGYVLYTFSALLERSGMVSLNFAVTALVIGSALLLLSAFWHPSRALVLRRVGSGLQSALPPFR